MDMKLLGVVALLVAVGVDGKPTATCTKVGEWIADDLDCTAYYSCQETSEGFTLSSPHQCTGSCFSFIAQGCVGNLEACGCYKSICNCSCGDNSTMTNPN